MSWLNYLVKSTENLEPPQRFFYWAGLSTIASIVKANVSLDRYSYVLYPNIYVILVSAKSGLRKGIPISYARGVLKVLDCTRVISGQNSFPDIIHELSRQKTTPNGKVHNEAQALLCAPEFDAFLLEDSKALPTLTDLYDTHQHIDEGWNKGLKSGTAFLNKPCINMLAASNEELLADVIHERDMKGGFLARTFIVHESKRNIKNSLMHRPVGIVPKSDLAEPLRRLIGLKGSFQITDSAKNFYDDWYNDIDDDSEDPTGTIERIGDSVLKIAMLISLSKSNDLKIDENILQAAIADCEGTIPGIKKVSASMNGKFEISKPLADAFALLMAAPDQELDRPKLLDKLGCEPLMLDRVIDTLQQREVIEIPKRKKDSMGRTVGPFVYKLKKKVYEEYLGLKGSI